MRRLRMKADYEEVRKAQILENQARLASLGVQKIIGELRAKSQSEKRKNNKVDYFSAPLRSSNRLKGNSAPSPKKGGLKALDLLSPEALAHRSNRLKVGVPCHFCKTPKRPNLGKQGAIGKSWTSKSVSKLKSISSKPQSEKRKRNKVDYFSTPLRRSNRLKGNSPKLALCRSDHLNENSRRTTAFAKREDVEKRPANAPLLRMKDGLMLHLTPEALARRCTSKDRGYIYDPVVGICCHFCRQKKLCGEEECKRCGDLDMDQPCLGKTDCSICHSSKGVLCRGCLKVRYGEEMEDVRANKEWVCPHCTEEKGINPYWICNSSLCLKKRKMAPTGIAIFRAREMGYKSVAHLLMDQLQGSSEG